jgi:hypothetical protein
VRVGFWWGNMRERDHLKDLGTDGRTMLKLSSRNRMGAHGLDWSDSG